MNYFINVAIRVMLSIPPIICSYSSVHAQKTPVFFIQLGHFDAVNSVSFSSDGKWALSGSSGGTIKLWDMSSREIRSFLEHSDPMTIEPIDHFRVRYHNPQKVSELLK
ncbi:MAG: hypothetical protein HQM12_17400 [SAR324 cluster bacterium]|nr:hypothetical protein [SAR324 cluster bacterium]